MNFNKFLLISIILFSSCTKEDDKTTLISDPPTIDNISHTGCKKLKSSNLVTQDCVNYEVYNNNYLKINRTNVAFNCCIDSVIVEIIENQNYYITIKETENAAPCNCNCLYDLEYIIGRLNYGIYTINIIEQYADTMTFTIDFNSSTIGEYCEDRTGYPWN